MQHNCQQLRIAEVVLIGALTRQEIRGHTQGPIMLKGSLPEAHIGILWQGTKNHLASSNYYALCSYGEKILMWASGRRRFFNAAATDRSNREGLKGWLIIDA
jgi:hypothetical protein